MKKLYLLDDVLGDALVKAMQAEPFNALQAIRHAINEETPPAVVPSGPGTARREESGEQSRIQVNGKRHWHVKFPHDCLIGRGINSPRNLNLGEKELLQVLGEEAGKYPDAYIPRADLQSARITHPSLRRISAGNASSVVSTLLKRGVLRASPNNRPNGIYNSHAPQ